MEVQELHKKLSNIHLQGDIFTDTTQRLLYATDASAYREVPVAVTRPKNKEDIQKLITFANEYQISVIPRAAGTSLAGQVVGPGIVMDISFYMSKIKEVNTEERWVKVEPGVNRDELNMYLKSFGLFFAPETATSNRCRIGGMLGNNSCGAHSVIYGSTRDHIIEANTILSDGTEAHFGPLTKEEFHEKCRQDNREGEIYRNIDTILSDTQNQEIIRKEYPDPENPRKNTGYALDVLMDSAPFTESNNRFNFCKLLAGSEGTLAFTTELKLNLEPLPPRHNALVCAHFSTIDAALRANLIALRHKPSAVEMMDDIVLDATKTNIAQRKNRFFVKDEPKAILIAEFERDTQEELDNDTQALIADMKAEGYGFHYPVITGDDIPKVWNLRKAGLGALANVPGDKKSTTVIEDTSVKPERLPEYISEFRKILGKYGLTCVFYAHVGSGELHLRPMLDLKKKEEVEIFRNIATDVAHLVKKYRGSLSGEHGDGRLRGHLIPLMLGENVYELLKEIKNTWDPNNILNPGKVTDAPPMTENLRYQSGKIPETPTWFDYSEYGGFVQAIERCNGSGDCRKSLKIGGLMCPTYMATEEEKHSTRARANILREILSHSDKTNIFDHEEIYNLLDECISCKACKSECPANVDMAKLKAEFLQHYYDRHGVPFRSKAVANIATLNSLGSLIPGITNFMLTTPIVSNIIKKILGFAPQRSIPELNKKTLSQWKKSHQKVNAHDKDKENNVFLFNDEFTNYNDTDIGIKAILLLTQLGYNVTIPAHTVSGRTHISKGLLRQSKKKAEHNIQNLKDNVSGDNPLIGIEPSAILSFRDEYPEIVKKELQEPAKKIANHAYLFEEFIANEIEAGRITHNQFTQAYKKIKLHGHCQQKAIATTNPTKKALELPANYEVEEIPSGCCGMAGSFGYEKEHYELSMQIGEMVLFPAVRNAGNETIIAAPGTSCRHQIKDGTDRTALHPVEILFAALK